MMVIPGLLSSLIFITSIFAHAGQGIIPCLPAGRLKVNDSIEEKHWVDSVFRTLTPEQRIAQLFIVRANFSGKPYNSQIRNYIREYNIGGVAFFRGDPVSQARITNEWQELAKTPLFIAIDAEWGLGMRLGNTISYPFQMALGAIHDDSLIYEMGKAIAIQCKRMGIHINFAPVVDVNSNATNPIIGMRSFGEDKKAVARKAIAYMKGMQYQGLVTTAKHFPGHGDTGTDSHLTLPIIQHDKVRLDTLELYPFKQLIENGVDGVMVAHLYIPAYEKNTYLASTLSPFIVDSLLRDRLNFKGLIFTDALDMKGVTKHHKPGDIEISALKAGNDILLLPQDVPVAINSIKKAIRQGTISQSSIDQKCKKVLHYKFRAGLNHFKPVEIENLTDDLHNPNDELLKRRLFEESITLVKNDNSIVPVKELDTLNIVSVSIGAGETSPFQQMLGNYAPIKFFQLAKQPADNEADFLLQQLSGFDLLIIDVQNTNIFTYKNYGVTEEALNFIENAATDHNVILNLFTCPYILGQIKSIPDINAILVSYQDDPVAQEISAQIIFGGIPSGGMLSVAVLPDFPIYSGINTTKTRLKYSIPEDVGIDRIDLLAVDSIIQDGIDQKAFPGCQVIAVKDEVVFYKRSFGYHTYDKTIPVHDDDLYDLASLTKIAATTPAVMKLYSEGKLDIDQKIGKYLPFLRNGDKKDIIIRDILTHQAKFQAWIPYYKYLIVDDDLNKDIISQEISEEFSVRVAENIYINKNYTCKIFDSIRFSRLRDNMEYKYSDLGFYLLSRSIENITNQPFEEYVNKLFHSPLGLTTMNFLPRKHFSLDKIVPTEYDSVFRKQLIHGDVHDQGAALLGGISGHAGLFSNANDMAIMMQMFLQKGNYGAKQYCDSSLVDEFTKKQFPLNDNRRGVGFDKPMTEYEKDGPVCQSTSPQSFGHSGFTGSYAWADPKNGLVYIFLSNRIYPEANNTLIMDLNIRTKIHQAFYDAIKRSNNKPQTD
jgi:beta-glucosidase-like glycosyl hydrolase/CubicO group peptidase (beta-lactamase class C family)